MNEKQLCTEIVLSLNEIPGTFAWKIPDASPMLRKQQKFIPARAFDILCCHNSSFIALEVKRQTGPFSVGVGRFTDFELRCLKAVECAGGLSYIAIGWWFRPTEHHKSKYGFGDIVKRLTLVQYGAFIKEAVSGGVSYSRLVDIGITLDYNKGWDFSRVLQKPTVYRVWERFKIRET